MPQALRTGSPPPTRGTRWRRQMADNKTGITPAYAGNTQWAKGNSLRAEDHPRLRGEHRSYKSFLEGLQGSSPPTRGTQRDAWKTSFRRGITPAYAGNTIDDCHIGIYGRDHPRLRGEHWNTYPCDPFNWGSPPPTRGTLLRFNIACDCLRITPAYAGNTLIIICVTLYPRDHPRLRGEHAIFEQLANGVSGSPPPTRGTLLHLLKKKMMIGITPAYAGNTL